MSHPSTYIGIFLDQSSKGLLYNLKKYAPRDWKWYGDHLTIKYFGAPRYPEDFPEPYDTLAEEGQDVSLVVSRIAISDKAMAVQVTGYPLDDRVSHITLATSKHGSPIDSNSLSEWKKVKSFTLHGTVKGNGDAGEVIRENEVTKQSSVKTGSDVSTGDPVTIHYTKNTEKAPNMGKQFGQDVEPSGFYVTQQEYYDMDNWELGVIEFKSPLVVDVNNDTLVKWKRALSKHLHGLKGARLTQAFQSRGYDGIITRHDEGHLGEIIAFNNAVIRKKETPQDELQETDETSETVIPMGPRWNDQMDGGDYATTVWAAPTTRVKYGGTMSEQIVRKLVESKLNEMPTTFPYNIGGVQATYDSWTDHPGDRNINEIEYMDITKLPFLPAIEKAGGKVYQVGGAVRDTYLNRQSKDLDIMVSGLSPDKLMAILKPFGVPNMVGESFAVIKFKPHGAKEDIDIALARTDKQIGDGHKGVEVSTDPSLTVDDDLIRRDFTINAIAKDVRGNIIDPYGGVQDLKDKVIRMVSPQAFADDPLRMMRAVQFAARFGFTIEPKTLNLYRNTQIGLKQNQLNVYSVNLIK